MWITLGIISSLFLGSYDIFKKWSLNDNAVIPVLFIATLSGAVIFLPLVVMSWSFPDFSSQQMWYLPPQSMHAHLLFLAKSLLVGTSWILAYFALKNHPITIVTPIRASAPLWTLLGALFIYGERFNLWQWSGIMITLGSYYLFSLASLKEGIVFKNNKWIVLVFLATILGAASSL